MTNALINILRRPQGPAGKVGPPLKGSYAAMHDRPVPQRQFDSGVRRGRAYTKGRNALDEFFATQRRRS